jgi:hypothetical protein
MVHGEEDSYLGIKHLCAIIYKDNIPVLELPIITLQAPHSIFLEMRKKRICSDITRFWKFGPKT